MTLSRLTCEETFRKLDHYLDRALSEGDVQLVEQHLETCAQCASEYRFEASFVDEMRSKLLGIAIPEGFRAKLLARSVDFFQVAGRLLASANGTASAPPNLPSHSCVTPNPERKSLGSSDATRSRVAKVRALSSRTWLPTGRHPRVWHH